LKLRGRRRQRLLAALARGETLTAACRCVDITTQTVNRHRRQDAVFAEAVRAACEQRAPTFVAPEPFDWRTAAMHLERSDPLHWALGDDSGDAFDSRVRSDSGDAFDFDPLGE
jgi:hypothetical protein